jgi:hypothetical protein
LGGADTGLHPEPDAHKDRVLTGLLAPEGVLRDVPVIEKLREVHREQARGHVGTEARREDDFCGWG